MPRGSCALCDIPISVVQRVSALATGRWISETRSGMDDGCPFSIFTVDADSERSLGRSVNSVRDYSAVCGAEKNRGRGFS